MTTLDDLKRAIDSFQAELNHPRGDDRYDLQLSRAKAWRTAFEWRDNIEFATVDGSYAEGMRLIREKLS